MFPSQGSDDREDDGTGLARSGILAPVKRVIVLLWGGLALAGCGSSGHDTTTSTVVTNPGVPPISITTETTTVAPRPPSKHAKTKSRTAKHTATATHTTTAAREPAHTVEGTSRVEEIENELRVARESLAPASTEEEHNHIEGEISTYERELSEAKH